MHLIRPSVFALGALLFSVAAPGHAATAPRNDFQGAAGMCKPALPQFNAGLRSRPLGMANESSATIFLTCNWQGDDTENGNRGARQLVVVVSNTAAAAQGVTCTVVNGFQSGLLTQATYTPKTATVEPASSATLTWLPADVGAVDQIKLPSLSCAMPAGTTLQFTSKAYIENVGA